VRILLWHGYLLGGTGSNVYTRQLAREWSGAGHDVTVLSQEPRPEAFDIGTAAAVRPEVGGFLPVFVLDRYDGYEVRLVHETSRRELERWVDANAAAVREHLPADLVFTNHVLLGGPVGVAAGAPYAVKAHGSELEYSMRGRPELERWGAVATSSSGSPRNAIRRSRSCSRRRGRTLRTTAIVRSGTPTTRTPSASPRSSRARPPPSSSSGSSSSRRGSTSSSTRFVGFGPERARLEARASSLGVRALFTGPLEHRHLRHLLAFADACVVPSVFPEAFGMVAAEAAAAGCPPVVARHSGLAEVAADLEDALPPSLAQLVSSPTGDADALRDRLRGVLELPAADRATLRATVRRVAEEQWSWAGIARRLLELSL
jgi:hypothetical protein